MTAFLVAVSFVLAFAWLYYAAKWVGGGFVRAICPARGRRRDHSVVTGNAPHLECHRVNPSPPAQLNATERHSVGLAVEWRLFVNDLPTARYTDLYPDGGPAGNLEEWTA